MTSPQAVKLTSAGARLSGAQDEFTPYDSRLAGELLDATPEATPVFPTWEAGIAVSAGDVYRYAVDDLLYVCVQGHTTQEEYTPVVARALWTRWYDPNAEPQPWVQPLGAHDAYRLGARVTHNGSTWESTLANNVWQPGVFGWTNLTPPPAAQEWVSGEQGLQVGARRTYQGATYEVIQNPGVNIWPPPTVPALWRAV